jgi:hypothetical protein
MQSRDGTFDARSPLEALLARADEPAIEYVLACLLRSEPVEPAAAPVPAGAISDVVTVEHEG